MATHSTPAAMGHSRTSRSAPSQADVARLAGVSGQTVSRVANGLDNVLPETRERVMKAMADLGYSPNQAARALRYGTFETIGVIAHQLARTGESSITEAVVEAARAAGHTVTLVDVSEPSSEEVTAAAIQLSNQAIDGLVIIRAEVTSPQLLSLPMNLPVVVSDAQFAGALPTVGADEEAGVRAVVEHLLDVGHRTVHLVAGPAGSVPAQVRRDAWEAALRSHGRDVPEVYPGDWTPASGYLAGLAVANDPAVTALWCANDEMAAGALLALHSRGIVVPDDVSVAGFDNVPLSEYLWPPLTTVDQNFSQIGQALVSTLIGQIRNGTAGASARTVIPTELVIRASTGPAAPSR